MEECVSNNDASCCHLGHGQAGEFDSLEQRIKGLV